MIGDELHKITWYTKVMTVIAIALSVYGFYTIGFRTGSETEVFSAQSKFQQDQLVASIIESAQRISKNESTQIFIAPNTLDFPAEIYSAAYEILNEEYNNVSFIKENQEFFDTLVDIEPNLAGAYSYAYILCDDCENEMRHHFFYNHATGDISGYSSMGVVLGELQSELIRERIHTENSLTDLYFVLTDGNLSPIASQVCTRKNTTLCSTVSLEDMEMRELFAIDLLVL